MRASPPSLISNVERRRTSVDLPDPFWPRIATHSPRSIVNVTDLSAGIRLRAKRPAFLSLRRNSFVRLTTSTAGVSRRTCVFSDVDETTVDMLLLQILRKWNARTGLRRDSGGART